MKAIKALGSFVFDQLTSAGWESETLVQVKNVSYQHSISNKQELVPLEHFADFSSIELGLAHLKTLLYNSKTACLVKSFIESSHQILKQFLRVLMLTCSEDRVHPATDSLQSEHKIMFYGANISCPEKMCWHHKLLLVMVVVLVVISLLT